MDKFAIENEARRLQLEIWTRRERRFELGVPDIPTIFDPRNVADFCELALDVRERLDADYYGGGEVAGIWQRDRRTILVSSRYPYEVQRFTAGHEIGHYVLHPHIGDRTLHREFPVGGARSNRPQVELEADHFAGCLLMPRGAVARAFEARFVSKTPLVLTEAVAWHLKADSAVLFSHPPLHGVRLPSPGWTQGLRLHLMFIKCKMTPWQKVKISNQA